MTRRRTRDSRSERGVVLAISAVAMTMLLVFAAFAIDLGTVYLHRQNDQTAADLAVIAASQDRFVASDAAATAATTLNDNLGTSFTTADLNTCDSITMPSGWQTYTGANCLAHDSSWTRMLLQVPPRTMPTGFARLAGVDSFEHSAFAVVAMDGPQGGGGVLPVIAQANAGAYQCLKVGAANVPDDQCSDNNSGNFGLANFGQFGNLDMGTSEYCDGQGTDRMAQHLAMGIDHDISLVGGPPHHGSLVVDTASCGTTPVPNAVTTITGNIPNWVGSGLIDQGVFSDGEPARLRRTGGLDWFDTTTIDGKTVDDTPLWEFIDPGLDAMDNVPRSCRKDQFVGDGGGLNPDNDEHMSSIDVNEKAPIVTHLLTMPVEERMIKLIERCFAHYRGQAWDDRGAFNPAEQGSGCDATLGCTDPIFTLDTKEEFPNTYDIQLVPRFAYVPVTTTPPSNWNGTTALTIDSIAPVYLQRVYGGNCSSGGCDITFDPGFGYSTSQSSQKVSAFTAFLFPTGTLPPSLNSPYAPNELGAHRFARLIR